MRIEANDCWLPLDVLDHESCIGHQIFTGRITARTLVWLRKDHDVVLTQDFRMRVWPLGGGDAGYETLAAGSRIRLVSHGDLDHAAVWEITPPTEEIAAPVFAAAEYAS